MIVFKKQFTQQQPLSDEAIALATEVLKTGRLHRYNVTDEDIGHTALLEQEYSHYMKQKYCLACASGGYAMYIALKAAGVESGDKILTNAFTLAPVPGAIHNAGGLPILVNVDDNLCVDIHHLEKMIQENKAKFFMISHMRGHLADMDKIVKLCKDYDIILIEDCAHTMGAEWDGKKSGSFGDIACFSTQTYKHMNSGEGGLLTTNHDIYMARAIIYSGSYMLYERHGTVPPKEIFNDICCHIPNYSGRMDNLRAAILRAQLKNLDVNCQKWYNLYCCFVNHLNHSRIIFPKRHDEEFFVGSSVQFRIPDLKDIKGFLHDCAERGVELKWFGADQPQGFTSRYDSWHYFDDLPILPQTLDILSHLFDMRIPLIFDEKDMAMIAHIITDVLDNY